LNFAKARMTSLALFRRFSKWVAGKQEVLHECSHSGGWSSFAWQLLTFQTHQNLIKQGGSKPAVAPRDVVQAAMVRAPHLALGSSQHKEALIHGDRHEQAPSLGNGHQQCLYNKESLVRTSTCWSAHTKAWAQRCHSKRPRSKSGSCTLMPYHPQGCWTILSFVTSPFGQIHTILFYHRTRGPMAG